MGRHFTLAALLLLVTFSGLVLAIVAPAHRYANHVETHADSVVAVAASADGSTFAALTGDGRVRIWDNAGRLKGSLQTQETFGAELLLSHNGKLLTAWGGQRLAATDQVQIWDVASRTVWQTLNFRVIGLDFSPTEDRLAVIEDLRPALAPQHRVGAFRQKRTHSPDGQLYVFDGQCSPKLIAPCLQAKFSPDGKTIAVVGSGGRGWLNIYDADSGKLLDAARTTRFALGDCLAWAPDGAAIAAVSCLRFGQTPSESIEKWVLKNGEARVVPLRAAGDGLGSQSHYHTITFLPDDRTLVVGAAGRGLKALDSSTLAPRPGTDMSNLWRVAAGQRGDRFIATDMRNVELWSSATLRPNKRLFQANAPPDHRLAACGLAVWLIVIVVRRRYSVLSCTLADVSTDSARPPGP